MYPIAREVKISEASVFKILHEYLGLRGAGAMDTQSTQSPTKTVWMTVLSGELDCFVFYGIATETNT